MYSYIYSKEMPRESDDGVTGGGRIVLFIENYSYECFHINKLIKKNTAKSILLDLYKA
jgi:hypothetical protein